MDPNEWSVRDPEAVKAAKIAEAKERALGAGRAVADAPSGEEIVISGMSGRFPDADDVHQYRDNLLNKVDMVSCDNRRWEPTHPEIPQRTGKINLITKFDAGHFGLHYRQNNTLDPMGRSLLERTVEALVDAGVNPVELENTNTGVFLGTCVSESERTWMYDRLIDKHFAITGCARSMYPNRISYWLKLRGPSFILDTACSSSLYAFEQAYRSIRTGKCDGAIVAGSNLCLEPYVSLQFARLGVLSTDGACKSFDDTGNGYARSEAICVVYLQKAKHARRVYAQVLHAKTNCDGYKSQGITYPSGETQKMLFEEFYEECGVDRARLSFMEAHGTGTKVGDPEEANAIDEVFCGIRDRPLLVGSVKSNIGHSEPSSGLCSVIKVLVGMESGYIPPNLHYSKPRTGVEALEQGRMVVVTEKTEWEDEDVIVGVNSFGFGGANCHVLLRSNPKKKFNRGLPNDDLPRLVCCSGRVESAVDAIFDDVLSRNLDVEHVRLLHEVFGKNMATHTWRGYSVVGKKGEVLRRSKKTRDEKFPLAVVFGSSADHLVKAAKDLLMLPLFVATVQRIHNVLLPRGLNIAEIIMKNGKSEIDNVPYKVLLCSTLQIFVADLLKTLGLKPELVHGELGGEIVKAYAEGSVNLEQTVLSLSHRANVVGDEGKLSAAASTNRDGLSEQLERLVPEAVRFNGTDRSCVVLQIGNSSATISEHVERIVFPENDDRNGIVSLLDVLGKLYLAGHEMSLDRLYPKVPFPVSRSTPMISPHIRWNHTEDWFVAFYRPRQDVKSGERKATAKVTETEWSFLEGHVIDGRNLFPATGYLNVVWESQSVNMGMMMSDMRIVFEDVKFHRATTISKERQVELIVMIQRGSGKFEVIEGGAAVVTGVIKVPRDISEHINEIPIPANADEAVLDEKDIYKELKLRGYHYGGPFKGLKSCNLEGTSGLIEWNGNWVTFMDNMLQIQILSVDTRRMYVPTAIKKLTIDAKKHIAFTQKYGDNPKVPIYVNKDANIIKSGAIEIVGLDARSIVRRKPLAEPVLEKHVFVPNEARLTTAQSVRVVMQIILENAYSVRFKALEIRDEAVSPECEPLSPVILRVLGDQPLIQPEMIIYSKEALEVPDVTVEDKTLGNDCDAHVVVVSDALTRHKTLQQVLGTIKDSSFVLTRQPADFEMTSPENTEVVLRHIVESEQLVLLRKKSPVQKWNVIRIEENEFSWLPAVQSAVKNGEKTVIYAQDETTSGILGLFNCIRREPGGDNLRCVFIKDHSAPPFDPSLPFYKRQLDKDVASNVYENGEWGTYKHLSITGNEMAEREHGYVNALVQGDLSSLKWIQGPLSPNMTVEPENVMVHVYWTSVNFRDVMTASGKISSDVVTMDRLEQECVQGFEFAGRDSEGNRVTAMIKAKAFSNLALVDRYCMYPVPDKWTLEEAVTVPVVYGTVLYAFFMRTRIKRGQSILIHSGSGGVGLAAIWVALYHGCTVFTTVGTKEKREFLKGQFPQLTDRHIGNSRDTSFEQLIKKETKGEGVDYVLNSLAEEKLQASLRCLKRGGTFLEIGKFDLASDNPLRLEIFKKRISFHSIMLDQLMDGPLHLKRQLHCMMMEGFANGCLQPLPRTLFKEDQIEEAFRFMASGKHVGKVVFNLREEESEKVVRPERKTVSALSRYICRETHTYIITGGLGGFGLELADWLILRGARKLVLTSRTGVKNGYQALRIKTWRSYGATVKISTQDITTEAGVRQLLIEANELGPVEAVFHLAVILKDGILENQTPETFLTSFRPKATAAQHLDRLTRRLCPHLRDFVIFSSVSCGRGNAGQSNYGMANSVMERVCELRKREGLPALAIQWGAIGEVGLVAEMQKDYSDLKIGGTLQQRISSCLEVLDVLLKQDEPIVSSMVVAEKHSGAEAADNVIDCVANILGIKDIKSVSLNQTLAELGMDSMTAVEIKQSLEREFEVFLTPQEIRSLTFARLIEIRHEQENVQGKKALKDIDMDNLPENVRLLLRCIGDEELAKIPLVRMDSALPDATSASAPRLFFVPGLEGMSTVLQPLVDNVEARCLCLQFTYESIDDTIADLAAFLFSVMSKETAKTEPYTLVAYSYGCVVALELIALLEAAGYTGRAIFVDGAPDMLVGLARIALNADDPVEFETNLLCTLLTFNMTHQEILQYREAIRNCNTYSERMEVALSAVPESSPHSPKYQREVALGMYKRLFGLVHYAPTFLKLATPITLFRPETAALQNIPEDYNLSQFTERPVEVKFYEGDHLTILENKEVARDLVETAREVSVAPEKMGLFEGGLSDAKREISLQEA